MLPSHKTPAKQHGHLHPPVLKYVSLSIFLLGDARRSDVVFAFLTTLLALQVTADVPFIQHPPSFPQDI